jgi:hypothetical protein
VETGEEAEEKEEQEQEPVEEGGWEAVETSEAKAILMRKK